MKVLQLSSGVDTTINEQMTCDMAMTQCEHSIAASGLCFILQQWDDAWYSKVGQAFKE